MPYCFFCGKHCPTVPGLNKHIDKTPKCKKASREEFGQYAKAIWEDVPQNPNDIEGQPPPGLPNEPELNLEDFHLEEDIARAQEMFDREENNLLPVPPPPPPLPQHDEPQHVTVDPKKGCRYIEHFPEEYLAGATWGNCKPLYEYINEEQEKEGTSRWSPFEDEEEWLLAEWLIRNVGQKQTDVFLKLPIVSFFFKLAVFVINEQQIQNRTRLTYKNNQNFLKRIDSLPTQASQWTCDIITSTGDQLTDDGEPVPPERLELWRRDPVECMKELMGNPIFKESLEYAPHKQFLDEEGNIRVFEEMWTGDWWWNTQVKLPPTCNAEYELVMKDIIKEKIASRVHHCPPHSILRQDPALAVPG